ncbi:MAG: hypothetical protein JKY65_01805 [Planctomycetes bacterium]|nr:hypothetical protein [Planctomycetota bacterium]
MESDPTTDLTQLGSFAELRDFLDRRREEPGSFEDFELELGKRMRAIEKGKGVASASVRKGSVANRHQLEASDGIAHHDRPDGV